MRLYDFLPSGDGYKVRLALRWLGIAFEYQEIDILEGQSRTPAFLAKNPFGQIPVLVECLEGYRSAFERP